MLIWPANSWVFWLVIAVGTAAFVRFGVYKRQGPGVSRSRLIVLAIAASSSVLITALLPSLVFGAFTKAQFPGDTTDSAMWTSAILLGCLAVGVGLWSVLADRARGRRRCPKCWYDMAGIPTLTCPECGRTVRSERRLRKTRTKWWGVLLAGLLLVLTAGGTLGPEIRQGGWPRILPDVLLISLLPYSDRSLPLQLELYRRCNSDFAERAMNGGGLLGLAAERAVRKSLRAQAGSSCIGTATGLLGNCSENFERFVPDTCANARTGNWNAVSLLIRFAPRDPRTQEVASDLANSGGPMTRLFGVSAMIQCELASKGSMDVTDRMETFASDADPVVRALVVHLTRDIPMTTRKSALLGAALNDPAFEVQRAGVDMLTLADPNDPRLHAVLLDWLQGTDLTRCKHAVWQVPMYGPAHDSLIAALPRAFKFAIPVGQVEGFLYPVAEGPLSPAQAASVLRAVGEDPTSRTTIAKVAAYMGPKGVTIIAELKEIEQAWRTSGDSVAADAMRASIESLQQLVEIAPMEPPERNGAPLHEKGRPR